MFPHAPSGFGGKITVLTFQDHRAMLRLLMAGKVTKVMALVIAFMTKIFWISLVSLHVHVQRALHVTGKITFVTQERLLLCVPCDVISQMASPTLTSSFIIADIALEYCSNTMLLRQVSFQSEWFL